VYLQYQYFFPYKKESTKNYEINEERQHVIASPGSIRRLTVAVLVNDDVTQPQQDSIMRTVSSAAGLNPSRGDTISVEPLPFSTENADRRAAEAQAEKEALIRNAEALKQEKVLQAEAIERMADAKKYEQIALATAQKEAMDMINESMAQNAKAAEFLLARDRVGAFNELAKNGSKDKILVPYEATELIGSLSVLKDFLGARAAK